MLLEVRMDVLMPHIHNIVEVSESYSELLMFHTVGHVQCVFCV